MDQLQKLRHAAENPFREHDGKSRPVPLNLISRPVEVRFRDGSTAVSLGGACGFDWLYVTPSEGDIVAWRFLLTPPPQEDASDD